ATFDVTITPLNASANCTGTLTSSNGAVLQVNGGASASIVGKGNRTFTITAPSDITANTSVTLTGDFGNAVTQTLTVSVTKFVVSVGLSPTSVNAGGSSTGTVTVSEAPTSNQTIALSYGAGASGAASTQILAGNTTRTFTVNTSASSSNGSAVIGASHVAGGTSSASATLTINGVTVANVTSSEGANPDLAGGVGNSFTVTVTPSDLTLSTMATLSSNDGRVLVDGGASANITSVGSKVFTITAPQDVASNVVATLTANINGDTSKSINATVKPFVTGVTFNTDSVFGGTTVVGSVTVSENPASATSVNLSSNNLNATVPATTTVQTNGSSSFNVTTNSGVPSVQNAQITASHTATGTSSANNTFALGPIPVVSSISTTSRYVEGGQSTTMTIVLSSQVMTDDYEYSFTSPNPALIPAPTNKPVDKGETTISFPIATNAPAFPSTNNVRLSVSALGGEVAACTIKVYLQGVKSVSLDNDSIFETDGATLTVNLAAPAVGATIVPITTSSNGRVSTFNVSVADGATSGSQAFTSSFTALNGPTTVVLTATANGYSKSANLTLNPMVQSFTITPGSCLSGEEVTATVTLAKTFLTDTTFTLTGQGFLNIVGTFTIPAGQTIGTRTLKAKAVLTPTDYLIKANVLGYLRKANVTVNPTP
ncbi:MAG: beta strand repeat-containing protein, partial [Fimbriimonas sp.]